MESFETLQFWLATTFPGFWRLAAGADQGSCLVDPGNQWYDLAAVDGDSFAYLTTRRAGPGKSEFGAHAFGPHAPAAAQALAEQVRVWDRDRRAGPGPDFAIWPKDTPDERLPEDMIIDKRHTRVTISWPAASATATGQGAPHDPERGE
jgi:protein-L-isoaspartate(D-aspartate) O-methyltransferase